MIVLHTNVNLISKKNNYLIKGRKLFKSPAVLLVEKLLHQEWKHLAPKLPLRNVSFSLTTNQKHCDLDSQTTLILDVLQELNIIEDDTPVMVPIQYSVYDEYARCVEIVLIPLNTNN